MINKIRTLPSLSRPKSFKECPVCLLNIHFRSWKSHQREHDIETDHLVGSPLQGMDPLHIRVENLKKTIARLESRPRLSKADSDLLAEYRSGMVVLETRLARETG